MSKWKEKNLIIPVHVVPLKIVYCNVLRKKMYNFQISTYIQPEMRGSARSSKLPLKYFLVIHLTWFGEFWVYGRLNCCPQFVLCSSLCWRHASCTDIAPNYTQNTTGMRHNFTHKHAPFPTLVLHFHHVMHLRHFSSISFFSLQLRVYSMYLNSWKRGEGRAACIRFIESRARTYLNLTRT